MIDTDFNCKIFALNFHGINLDENKVGLVF